MKMKELQPRTMCGDKNPSLLGMLTQHGECGYNELYLRFLCDMSKILLIPEIGNSAPQQPHTTWAGISETA